MRRHGSNGSGRRLPSRFTTLLSLAPLLISGCQAVGIGGGSHRAGVIYQGTITLDGGVTEAALELTGTRGREVLGALQTTSGLIADGEGRRRGGDRLSLTLRYEGSCPGSMTLDGTWDRGAGTFLGNAQAEDCTGQAQGTFDLRASGAIPARIPGDALTPEERSL